MSRLGEIFKGKEQQEQFDRYGFFTVQAFSDEQLRDIRAFYDANPIDLTKDFYSSIESKNYDYRVKVDSYLKTYFTPLIDLLFQNYRSLAATFIVKRGANSTIYDHTDDCLIDEAVYTSVNVWCPLVDTDKENGAIRVLPGSHKIPNAQRGFGIPFRFGPFAEVYQDRMVLCPLKAGEALVYDPRLIHNSYPNLSGKDRPAIITGAIPAEATPIAIFRYPGLGDDVYEEFEVDTKFWHSFNKFARPEGYKSLGIKKYEPTTVTLREFLSYLVKK
jgi:hypothetical protein